MSITTKIQWCDSTVNFWRGCSKVSEGCKNCYITSTFPFRSTGQKHGDPRVKSKTAAALVRQLAAKPWVCDYCGEAYANQPFSCCASSEFHRRRVFVNSLSDWLDHEAPIEWLLELLNCIHSYPQLDFILVTKRPESWSTRLLQTAGSVRAIGSNWVCDWLNGKAPENVWVLVSVENQAMADQRIPELLRIPARVRGLSCEPLLGPVNLDSIEFGEGTRQSCLTPIFMGRPYCYDANVNWVIIGGESGPMARACDQEWIRYLALQCEGAGVPVFVKQMGTYSVQSECDGVTRPRSLKDPKGGDPAEWATDLRRRQFPNLQASR